MCARRSTLRLNPPRAISPFKPRPPPSYPFPGGPWESQFQTELTEAAVRNYAKWTAGQNKTKLFKSEFDGSGKTVIVRV